MRAAASSLSKVVSCPWLPSVAWISALLGLLIALPAGGSDSTKLMSSVSPLDGQTVSGTIRWEVELETDAPSRVDFAIDGKAKWTEHKAPFVFNGDDGVLDTTVLPDGEHTLQATLRTRGNDKRADEVTEQLSVEVVVANRRPEVRVRTVKPANGAAVSGAVRWEASVDGDPADRVDFLVDGVVQWTERQPPYVFNGDTGSLDTTKLVDGSHTLTATATAGDATASSSVEIRVSNAPAAPAPTFSTNVTQGMTVTAPFSWRFTPGDPSVKGFFWADGKLLATVAGPGPYTWTLPAGLLSNGAHVLGHSWELADGQRKSAGSSYSVTISSSSTPVPPPSGPTFSTNVTQGMTVSTPFSWRFTPGDPSVKGLFWADGKLLATVAGPGPYTWTLPAGVLGDGTHTLGHSWELADGQRKSAASSYSVTVSNGASNGSDFTTNLTQGMTVKPPFEWTFSPGEPSLKGYFWADGKVLATVAGSGPYKWTLPVGLLSDGTHVLGHAWETSPGQRRSPASSYTVTVSNGAVSLPGGSGPFGSALSQRPPSPAVGRTIAVDTVAELKSAFAGLQSGDRVVVEPGSYGTQHTIKSKRLGAPAEILFKPGARLTGGSRSSGTYVGLYVSDSDNIWFRGGDFSNPEGDAVKIDSSTNIVFDGSVAHHSGDSCFMVAANTRDNRAIWLINVETFACGSDRGDIASSGTYPVGYWRKGTHGIYYGSSRNGYKTYGGAIVNLYGHDQPNGSILQVGNGARGLVVTGATLVRATGDPSVYAGNALNFWGDYNESVLWVNTLVYRVSNHVMQCPLGTQGSGSGVRSLLYANVGSSTLFERSTSGAPTIGQIWNADPQLGSGDIPAASSPAVGKADPAYLWPTDRRGNPRTSRTLGAFEPSN